MTSPIAPDQPLQLLGGLSPRSFMRRYWQRRPLLVRQAVPAMVPLLKRADLFRLAARDDVESRLVERDALRGWRLREGPLARRSLPPLERPEWSLLVQGADLHSEPLHALLRRFRFVPDARLDDVMVSWASPGGGVGAHFDSYDVFLLQAQGQRRWRVGAQKDLALQEDAPLKLLRDFQPTQEWVLDPGDMLYLPPCWAHEGVAVGECMTYSIGFRAPARGELARELLQRVAEEASEAAAGRLYRDAGQEPARSPAAVPPALQEFASAAVAHALRDPAAVQRALGEYLTEPKANVWFAAGKAPRTWNGLVLDRRTRMMHDGRHVFVNGESWRASGRDAAIMRSLADARRLDAEHLVAASEDARELLATWCEAGWAHGVDGADGPVGGAIDGD